MSGKAFHDYDLSIARHCKGRTSFDADLLYGERAEAEVLNMIEASTISLFNHTKVEVKCDRQAVNTGNLFFEYRYKGRPSGIAITKAEWFAYDAGLCLFFFRTEKLREFLRRTYKNPYYPRAIGDGNNSLGLLVPIRDITKEALK